MSIKSSIGVVQESAASGQRQRRLVLSEEDYTSTLSSIVQRDYYPQINALERQNALLECRLRGDVAGAVAVRRATRRLMEHEEAMEAQQHDDDQSLLLLEDGTVSGGSSTSIRKRPRPLHEESLTGFHARVTNEDDEEFDSNLKQEIQDNRQRLQQVFQLKSDNDDGNQNSMRALLENSDMASDDFVPTSNQISASEWERPTMKNGLFFNPTPLRGAPAQTGATADSHREKKLLADSGAADVGFSSPNALMLPPTKSQTRRIQSGHTGASSSSANAAATKAQLVEYIPKHNLERKIDPSQTRFPSTGNNSIIPVLGRGGSGLLDASDTDDTESYGTDTSLYTTDLDAPLRPVDQERQRRKKRQRKEQQQQHNQSYVAMTPQIVPGVTGNTSPITTWGTIDQTPVILAGQDPAERNQQTGQSTSTFLLPAASQREDAARRAEECLAQRAKRAKSANKKKSNISAAAAAATSSRSKTLASLTPRAMSLMQKQQQQPKGRLSSRSRDAFGSALRDSYSQIRPGSSSSSVISGRTKVGSRSGGSKMRKQRDHAFNATPQL